MRTLGEVTRERARLADPYHEGREAALALDTEASTIRAHARVVGDGLVLSGYRYAKGSYKWRKERLRPIVAELSYHGAMRRRLALYPYDEVKGARNLTPGTAAWTQMCKDIKASEKAVRASQRATGKQAKNLSRRAR